MLIVQDQGSLVLTGAFSSAFLVWGKTQLPDYIDQA